MRRTILAFGLATLGAPAILVGTGSAAPALTVAPAAPIYTAKVSLLADNVHALTSVMQNGTQIATAQTGPGDSLRVVESSPAGAKTATSSVGIVPSEPTDDLQMNAMAVNIGMSRVAIMAEHAAFLRGDAPTIVATKTITLPVVSGAVQFVPTAVVKGFAHPMDDVSPQPRLTAMHAGDIYDDGCASLTKSVYWRGCYTRTSVPSSSTRRYSLDESQASGHGNFNWFLRTGRTEHKYANNSYTRVIKWNPQNTISAGSCHTVSISLAFEGVGISDSFQVCPSNVSIHIADHDFYSQWNGRNGGGNVSSDAMDVISVARGHASGFGYWIYDYRTWY